MYHVGDCCIYLCMCMCVSVYVCVPSIRCTNCVCTRVYINPLNIVLGAWPLISMYVCMYLCVCVCMCVCMHDPLNIVFGT
jgi:hypothetical protein